MNSLQKENQDHAANFNIDGINLDELVGPREEGFHNGEGFDEHDLQARVEQGDPEMVENQVQHHLNVGLALMNLSDADPVWIERSKIVEATRMWANYIAKGNAESLHVSIPSQWANFFTSLLLSPDIVC